MDQHEMQRIKIDFATKLLARWWPISEQGTKERKEEFDKALAIAEDFVKHLKAGYPRV